MPTQSRGFFSCDYCGLACDTLEEAKEHELQCSRRPQQQQQGSHPPTSSYYPRYPGQPPPPYGAMGPLSNSETEQYPPPHGHMSAPGEAAAYHQKQRCIPLMSPYERGSLIPPDSMACQHIEIFEATPEHVAEHNSAQTGGAPIASKQVGLRCIFCSRSPGSAESYSMAFPANLNSFAMDVRMIADNHLSICSMAPGEIRSVCEKAATTRRRNKGEDDEENRSRMALMDYCAGLCQQMGIINKPGHGGGLQFADGGDPSGPYGHPPAAETPSANRGPPTHPYSNERMGPPGMYPTPGPPGRFMMGGPMGGGDAIAPTPLQRRRDRPAAESGERQAPYSAERDGNAPSSGYPTPYNQGQGGESYGGSETPGMQTPVQPNFEGQEGSSYPTPHSAHQSEASPPGYQQYDLPNNFPFYQESNRTWHCKYCSHIHPQYRDPQSVWSAPTGGPPPGNFIDHHLSMCRAYHQSMPSPPMYQGPPPPYGPPYMAAQHMAPYGPPPGAWDGITPPHAGMHPQHLQYPPGPPGEMGYPYPPPHHLEHPGRYPGHEDPAYADQRARGGPPMVPPGMPGAQPPGMPPHMHGPPGALGGRPGAPPGPPRKEDMADSVRHAINHLVARETEQLQRDPAAANLDKLVLDEDRLLLTDYFFFLMKQLRLCRFSESDRKTRGGKREKIKLGYGGLQCVHCADVPNSRKFFWSNVDRLANSFAEIPGHILKCRRCPQQSKDALLQLKQFHPEQMARLPRGSQKVFFRRMWRRLHDEDPTPGGQTPDESNAENVAPKDEKEKSASPQATSSEAKKEQDGSPSSTSKSDDSVVVMQRSTKEAAKALAAAATQSGPPSPSSRILLAIPDDKEWLSDMDCFIRKQLEVFCATEEDVAIAQSDRKYPIQVGQVGIRCIHCSTAKNGSSAKGHAVAFPFAISGIYESVREFQRLHLDSCENLPEATKAKLAAFKGSSSLSSVLRKYYVLGAKALGLQDTRDGIRSGGESASVGPQAAFSFTEAGAGAQASEDGRRSASLSVEVAPAPTTSPAPTPSADASSPDVPKNSPSRDENSTPKDENKKRASSSSTEELEPPSKMAKTELPEVVEAAEV